MNPKDAINRVSKHGDNVEWEAHGARFRARRPDDVGRNDVVHHFMVDRDTGDGWKVNGKMDPLELRSKLTTMEFEVIQTARW